MLFLVLQKEGREGFAGIQLRLTLHQIRTLTWPFLSLTIRLKKMRNKTLIFSIVLVVPPKTTMEKNVCDVRNISDGRTHFVLVWRKILLESLVRDKNCFYSYFVCSVFVILLYSVTIHCVFCVNYSPAQIRNTCA